jgi:hypothetical protein
LVTLTLTLLLCAACEDFSARGFVGLKQGTLVAAPGISIDEVQRRSSLRLSSIWTDPHGARWATTKEVPLLFDARVAGTSLRFDDCVYHVVETLRGGNPIVRRVQLDLRAVAWNDARRELLSTRDALRRDGWQYMSPDHPEFGAEGTLMEGIELGGWQKGQLRVRFYALRDIHSDDHAQPRDALWQEELTLLLREP